MRDKPELAGRPGRWRGQHTGNARGGRPRHLPGRSRPAAGPGEGAHPRGRRDRGGPPAAAHGGGGPRHPLAGPDGPVTLLEAFEGRRQLIAYYFMWHAGQPAAGQCEGCTFYNGQIGELSSLHSRDITYAIFCQGPYEVSARYRDFMGWDMPWYSAQDSVGALLAGRQIGLFHLVCYLRDGDRVFETYWTTAPRRRGDGLQLRAHGPHRARTPGIVGGLAPRLAATMHQRADRRRPARLDTSIAMAGRTPHRPVVATRSRTLRRPRHRPPLSRSALRTRPGPGLGIRFPRWGCTSGAAIVPPAGSPGPPSVGPRT